MNYKLRFSQYNERSILVEWPAVVDENMLGDVLNFKEEIKRKYVELIVEVVSAYSSILIIYAYTIEDVNGRFLDLKSLYLSREINIEVKPKTYKIPVCYEDEYAMDLETYADEKKQSKSAVIRLHTETIYTVFFIGFLPGFLYLGGLDSRLHLDRKITPNLNVKKGAVGIGGKQTGIYPQDSPGGWHIIGNSPVELFNPKHSPPCFINAGDRIQFYAISVSEYHDLKNEIALSNFDSKTLLIHD